MEKKEMSKKLMWLTFTQVIRSIYAVIHAIVAPIAIVCLVAANEYKGGDPHKTTFGLCVLILILITEEKMMDSFEAGRIELVLQYDKEYPETK